MVPESAKSRKPSLFPQQQQLVMIIACLLHVQRRTGYLFREQSRAVTPKKFLLTAFSSPRLPHFAKWALRLALELPAATPHKARRMLEKLNRITLGIFDSAGDRQSSTIAVSLKMSAAKRYILHSGSRAVPSLWANRIVAILPVLS